MWPKILTAKSWEVTAELAERQLGELPLISSLGLDEQLAPLRVGLHAQVGHAPRSEPDGTFEAQLRWEPPRTLRRASAICTDRASGRALLAAKWAQERLGVELSGGARSDDTVKVSARTRLLFSELLAGRVRELAGFLPHGNQVPEVEGAATHACLARSTQGLCGLRSRPCPIGPTTPHPSCRVWRCSARSA
jgi:hypothetical protein